MTDEPIEVFFSYCHADENYKDELVKHLSILQRQGVIAGWHDRLIAPGSEWSREIDRHLASADIILLLVSSDFLFSDYCWGVEIAKALQRHEAGEACVIPVVLRYVDWHDAPIAKLQALPKNAKPIKSWPDQDEAFTNVAEGIRAAVKQIRDRRQQSRQQPIVSNQPTESSSVSPVLQMTAEEFFDRAVDQQNNGDNQGAITNYGQAIQLKPDYADAYYNRGLLGQEVNVRREIEYLISKEIYIELPHIKMMKYFSFLTGRFNSRDFAERMTQSITQSAMREFYGKLVIADFQKAADLYQQQGNTEWHQNALAWLKELQP